MNLGAWQGLDVAQWIALVILGGCACTFTVEMVRAWRDTRDEEDGQ